MVNFAWCNLIQTKTNVLPNSDFKNKLIRKMGLWNRLLVPYITDHNKSTNLLFILPLNWLSSTAITTLRRPLPSTTKTCRLSWVLLSLMLLLVGYLFLLLLLMPAGFFLLLYLLTQGMLLFIKLFILFLYWWTTPWRWVSVGWWGCIDKPGKWRVFHQNL